MADGVYVAMAREIERAIEVADRDTGPRELHWLREQIERFEKTARARLAILERQGHDRATARLPYKDD